MRTVKFKTQKQQHDNWCWAAVGSMVHEHLLGKSISQCQLAARLLDHPCCTQPKSCNQAESLAELLRPAGCLRGNAPKKGPLTITEIVREIDEHEFPIPVRIAGRSSNAHLVMIFGYDSTTNRDYLAVFDPRQNNSKLHRLDQFPSSLVDGTVWTHSYLLRRPR